MALASQRKEIMTMRLQKDEAVMRAISMEEKCLLGRAADLYRNDGTLRKRYRDQLNRLGLRTVKAVATSSYTIQIYAVREDYVPQALRISHQVITQLQLF